MIDLPTEALWLVIALPLGGSLLLHFVGRWLGEPLAGYLADHFGSYRPAFTLLAALAGLGAIIFLLARRPKLRP